MILLTTSVCVYNGKEHKIGSQFPAKDGCNTCHCKLVNSTPKAVCATDKTCGM